MSTYDNKITGPKVRAESSDGYPGVNAHRADNGQE